MGVFWTGGEGKIGKGQVERENINSHISGSFSFGEIHGTK